MSPFNAYISNIGLETLHLRMERHSENALAVAKWLASHERIEWVNYPGLDSNENYSLAQQYLKKGASGVLTFGIKGGLEAAKEFIANVKLATLVTHVADARTCVIHPASTTHRQLNAEDQRLAGVTSDLIRLSVGIEDVSDIIADLEAALVGAKHMPIIIDKDLPARKVLQKENIFVMTKERAETQDIRALKLLY